MPKAGEYLHNPPKKMPDGDKKGSSLPQLAPYEAIGAPVLPTPAAVPASPRTLDLGHTPY